MKKTASERAAEQRAEKLAMIDEQLKDGSLVIRQMTTKERERYQNLPEPGHRARE